MFLLWWKALSGSYLASRGDVAAQVSTWHLAEPICRVWGFLASYAEEL